MIERRRQRRARSIRQQLIALFAGALFLSVALLVVEEFNRRAGLEAMQNLRSTSLELMRLTKAISDSYGLWVVDTTFRVRNQLISAEEGEAIIDRALVRIENDWRALERATTEPEQLSLLAETRRYRLQADAAARDLRAILQADDRDELARFADQRLYPSIDPVTLRMQALAQVEQGRAELNVDAEAHRGERVAWLRLAVVSSALLLFVVIGRRLIRRIYRGVESLTALAGAIRRQDFTSLPTHRPDGELGDVMRAMMVMRDDLGRTQYDLAESEARALEATRAKSSFVATMSHEIRTPLIGVTGMLEVLSHTRLEREQRSIVDVVQQSAAALLQIIGDVLDFSKIEADRLVLEPSPTDLASLLRSTVSNFEGAASGKGLLLESDIAPHLARAYLADGLRVRQIVSNLVSNALKFTESGGVCVRVMAEPTSAEKHRITIEVRDTGIGMSDAQRERLFEPFAQAETSTTRRFGGTGLGLTISRRLVALMGGTLELDSAIGEGTCVRVSLELVPSATPVEDSNSSTSVANRFLPRSAPPALLAQQQNRLVLLVDDHPTNREVIARQLGLAGYACERASHGREGLERWRTQRFGLVLTDVHMPEMDGYELTRAIRKEEQQRGLKKTPIVALTAAVTAEDAARCYESGMDAHLSKPATVPQLAATLDRYLGAPNVEDVAAIPMESPIDRIRPAAVSVDLDGAVLDALSGGDAATAKAILSDFLETTDTDLAALRASWPDSPMQTQRQAHRIVGAARMVGAMAVAEAAARVEEVLRLGGVPDLEPLADAMTALRAATS